MSEEDVLAFVRASVATIWELELLLLLERTRERTWRPEELNRELRASQKAISRAAHALASRGLAKEDDGRLCYAEGSGDDIVQALARLTAEKPFLVITAIADAQNTRVKNLADAFRWRG